MTPLPSSETTSRLATRRELIAAGTTFLLAGPARFAAAIEPFARKRPSHFKLSLAAYSYRDYLSGDKPAMDLFDFVGLAADLGLDAIEPTSYYFPPDVSTDYLHRLKRHAFVLGLDISGTATMNDFCLPEGPDAEREVSHVRRWIDHAADLDAPTLRIMSGNWIQGTPDEELAQRVLHRIESLLPYAAERGVMLALENHGGGVTVTAEQLLGIVAQTRGNSFGVNLDTGNFHGPDPYAEIAAVAPFAINVQIKTEIRRKGRTKEPADLAGVIEILRAAHYSGYLVLEYNASEDAKIAVPRYVKELRSLIS